MWSGAWNGLAGTYLNAYNNIMAAELYKMYPQVNAGFETAFNAYMTFLNLTTGTGTGTNACTFQVYPPSQIPPP